MVSVEGPVLAVHVLFGFLALATGAGALLTKKGARRHKLLGRSYVYGMAVVSVTALVLLAIDQSLGRIFLGLVAVFSFYFAFSGYRVLSRKRAIDAPGRVDWAALALFGASGVSLVAMGVWFLIENTSFGVVMVVFGAIALVVTAGDARQFRATDLEPRTWFFEHIQRMGGAYIATVTAFASVNATFLPMIARWLLPTALGAVAIWYVSRRYRQRFDAGVSATTAD